MFEYPFENGLDHLFFGEPKPEEYGFDPDNVDPEMWEQAIAFAKDLAYQMAEGLIELREEEDGTIKFYPTVPR